MTWEWPKTGLRLTWKRQMKIESYRQTFIIQMKISISWAPDGAKNVWCNYLQDNNNIKAANIIRLSRQNKEEHLSVIISSQSFFLSIKSSLAPKRSVFSVLWRKQKWLKIYFYLRKHILHSMGSLLGQPVASKHGKKYQSLCYFHCSIVM